jgi:GNAT superfamily N-acetyltransferase
MAQVRRTARIRGGIGLAAERLGHGPDVLVTTASDHVALRTPSRPDHFSGNAIHLYSPPTALAPWLDRHANSIGRIPGVTDAFVCWEVEGDLAPDAPHDAQAPHDGQAAHDAQARLDLRAELELPDDVPAAATVEVVSAMVWRPDLAVEDGAARRAAVDDLVATSRVDLSRLDLRSGADERVMAGARALYLQAGWGDDVDYWRWHVAQQLDLMVAGRCRVWVAYVQGIPASRVSVMHDRAGLAIVEDVVTHPLHRGRGLASAIVVHALGQHLAARPADTVVIRAEASGPARRIYERLGFTTVATDVSVRMPLAS